MPSYDFEVDLIALERAARGVADTVEFFKDKDVEDLVPVESAVGHEAVWGALAEFKDRWELGLNTLMRDVEEAAGRLGMVLRNYAQFDKTGAETLHAVAKDVGAVRVPPR